MNDILPVIFAEKIIAGSFSLDPLVLADSKEMVNVLADPALYEFIGGEPLTQLQLLEKYSQQTLGYSSAGDEIWLNWVLRDSGTAIGYVQATVTMIDGQPSADLAWLVGTPWQSQGYATMAVQLMMHWLMQQDVDIFTAEIAPNHAASQRIAEKLNLQNTHRLTAEGEEIWSSIY